MEEKKRVISIEPARMQLAEQWRQEWVANAPEGATVEDIVKPEFWALMSSQFKPYDRIEVRADDGSWMAELVVLNCDRTWAKVCLLKEYKLASTEAIQTPNAKYEIKWRGPHHKWSVIRLADDNCIKSECATREEAAFWLKEHDKAM